MKRKQLISICLAAAAVCAAQADRRPPGSEVQIDAAGESAYRDKPEKVNLWAGSEWITSELNAPDGQWIDAWVDAATLDLRAQEPNATAADLEDWRLAIYERLSLTRSPVVFRKEFVVQNPVRSARLLVSGLGYYHAQINGKPIGDHALAPNMSHFDVEARYNTFDVASQLRSGENQIEVVVAPGRLYELPGHFLKDKIYSETPLLRAVLELDFADGTTQRVVTDTSWKAALGPIRRAAFWVGEVYDARVTPSDWQPVRLAKNWNPEMIADDLPPQRIVRELQPVSVNEPQPGVWVYDFGRMTVGKVRLKLPPGARVAVRYAELRMEDVQRVERQFFPSAPFLQYPEGTDVSHPGMIRPKGRGSVSGLLKLKGRRNKLQWGFTDLVQAADRSLDWHASFDYVGFRYVEITGLAEPLPDGAVTAVEIHNDLPRTGRIRVGHPELQAVADAAWLSILLNIQGTYEDNPGAERMGANSNIAMLSYPHAWYNFDNQGLARKAMHDSITAAEIAGAPTTVTLTKRHAAGVREVLNGRKPVFAPITVIDGFHYGMTPLDLIRFYGNHATAANTIDHCAFYFECLLGQKGYPRSTNVGDHLDYTANLDIENRDKSLHPTDNSFVVGASALWQGNAFIEAATLLGRDDLVQKIQPMLDRLREEIDSRHLDPSTGRYAWRTSAHRMGANTLAILAGLVPEPEQSVWIAEIIDDIRRNNNHLTTGSRLTGPLLSLLARTGHIDEAIRLTTREDYPSPYAMLSITGGTISESWGQPGLPAGSSLVQAEGFAAAANWMYESLVGIAPTSEGPGFKRFRLAPVIPDSIPSCSFTFDSPQGRIESNWKKSDGYLEWMVRVPSGATAELTLPSGTAEDWQLPDQGIRILEPDTLEVESGTFLLKSHTR